MKECVLEVCCGSYQDCVIAEKAGATRVELNSALSLGGLTPSLATVKLVKEETNLKVMVMIRPRGAGFCYDDQEFKVMMEDAKMMLDIGADGIVFGCLTSDGKIQENQTRKMVNLIQSYHRESVIHRAFDCIEDSEEAIEWYIELGITRILTAGKQSKVIDGADVVQQLQKKYGQKIEILAGSGLNAENVIDFLNYTQCTQVHSSCKGYCADSTTIQENFSFAYLQDGDYEVVSFEKVKDMQNKLTKMQKSEVWSSHEEGI